MTEAQWLSDVYAAVDDVCATGRALPPGAIGKLARLVDTTRTNPTAQPYVQRADDMLVTMHRLRSALTSPYATGQADVADFRNRLATMRDDWIRSVTIC